MIPVSHLIRNIFLCPHEFHRFSFTIVRHKIRAWGWDNVETKSLSVNDLINVFLYFCSRTCSGNCHVSYKVWWKIKFWLVGFLLYIFTYFSCPLLVLKDYNPFLASPGSLWLTLILCQRLVHFSISIHVYISLWIDCADVLLWIHVCEKLFFTKNQHIPS